MIGHRKLFTSETCGGINDMVLLLVALRRKVLNSVVTDTVYVSIFCQALYLLVDEAGHGPWARHLGQEVEVRLLLAFTSVNLLNMLDKLMSRPARFTDYSIMSTAELDIIAVLYASVVHWSTSQISRLRSDAIAPLKAYLLTCLELLVSRKVPATKAKGWRRLANKVVTDMNESDSGKIAILYASIDWTNASPRTKAKILQDVLQGADELWLRLVQGTGYEVYHQPVLLIPSANNGDHSTGISSFSLWSDELSQASEEEKVTTVWCLVWKNVLGVVVRKSMKYEPGDFLLPLSYGCSNLYPPHDTEFPQRTWQEWDAAVMSIRYQLYQFFHQRLTCFTSDEQHSLERAANYMPYDGFLGLLNRFFEVPERIRSCFRWWMVYVLSDIGLINSYDIPVITSKLLELDNKDKGSWRSGWYLAEQTWLAWKSSNEKQIQISETSETVGAQNTFEIPLQKCTCQHMLLELNFQDHQKSRECAHCTNNVAKLVRVSSSFELFHTHMASLLESEEYIAENIEQEINDRWRNLDRSSRREWAVKYLEAIRHNESLKLQ